MSALETVLTIAVLLLGAALVAGMVVAGRLIRDIRLRTGPTGETAERVGATTDADLAQASSRLDEARAAIATIRTETATARTEAAAARADAAAAKAEAAAARGDARRILDSARSEADGILERAHKQADHDADQVRASARRAGEREIATLTAVAKEQTADAERRQLRLDDRERLLAEEAERLADRDRRLTTAEADLGEREGLVVGREAELATASQVHQRELERVAGLTADSAKAELVESIETQAKRDAVILARTIENEAAYRCRGPGPVHRGRGDPAGCQRADGRERGQRAAPARRTR